MSAPQLFETPPDLAARMVALADIQAGQRVLEPSAGTGRLVELLDAFAWTAVEISADLCSILAAHTLREGEQRTEIVCEDFMHYSGGLFDRVVMNPPFSGGQDIAHVQRAFSMLRPGGRLVAIMCEGPFFRVGDEGFRSWLREAGGTSEQLPRGTFKESGTNVATRLVVVDL